jgi:hypothetical protein
MPDEWLVAQQAIDLTEDPPDIRVNVDLFDQLPQRRSRLARQDLGCPTRLS